MGSVVFDASAILALLRSEKGSDAVADHIGDGLISAVNFQEVLKELLRRGIALDVALEMLAALHLDVVAHDQDAAIASAALYPATREYGSGLGDRTCMALAMAEGLPALTADRAWSELDIDDLAVVQIR